MAKHYKIVYGFGEADYIPIVGDELPKAIAVFMDKTGRAVFNNGAIRGQDILRITEDWHAERGWNKGYKMTPLDWEDVAPLQEPYRQTYERAKEIAEFAIKENRRDLLSIPASEAVKQLPPPEMKEIHSLAEGLADKLRVKEE